MKTARQEAKTEGPCERSAIFLVVPASPFTVQICPASEPKSYFPLSRLWQYYYEGMQTNFLWTLRSVANNTRNLEENAGLLLFCASYFLHFCISADEWFMLSGCMSNIAKSLALDDQMQKDVLLCALKTFMSTTLGTSCDLLVQMPSNMPYLFYIM